MKILSRLHDLLINAAHTKWLCLLQAIAEALLCTLIIHRVPYTKIDWTAYMQQVTIYLAGERDYAKLTGETGPLVYPAAHVYIYRVLHALTSQGTDIRTAQYLFAALYVLTLAVVMQCYRQAGVPPWVFPLLSLSKRVHSIFVLRLFNDCFAVLFLFAAVGLWQKRWWTVGTVAFGVGVGVKMSLLLALPAVGMVLWLGMGRDRAFYQAQSLGQIQILLAYPFISTNFRSYFGRAFEFTRQFMFKWTVNWRFMGEEWFLSRPFSLALLGTHLALLYSFGLTRWLEPSGYSLSEALNSLVEPPSKQRQASIARNVTPRFTMTAILSSVLIGCLCARSLHYQFFVYIAWSTPFLLWRSGMRPVLIYATCFAQEWAWNVYPSTSISSAVVVSCLALTLTSVWIGTRPREPAAKRTAVDCSHAE